MIMSNLLGQTKLAIISISGSTILFFLPYFSEKYTTSFFWWAQAASYIVRDFLVQGHKQCCHDILVYFHVCVLVKLEKQI